MAKGHLREKDAGKLKPRLRFTPGRIFGYGNADREEITARQRSSDRDTEMSFSCKHRRLGRAERSDKTGSVCRKKFFSSELLRTKNSSLGFWKINFSGQRNASGHKFLDRRFGVIAVVQLARLWGSNGISKLKFFRCRNSVVLFSGFSNLLSWNENMSRIFGVTQFIP